MNTSDSDHGHDTGSEHAHGDHAEHEHDHGHDRAPSRFALIRFFQSLYSGHSHDHVESLDTVVTSSTEGLRALKVSVAVLAATAILQMVIVVLSGSVALLGDTLHNAGDVATAIPLGFAFWLQRRPPSRRYTFGYGRAEDLAGVFICIVMGISAISAAWLSIDRLLHPHVLTHVWFIMAGGLIGFVGNETVALYRIRVGRHIGSSSLVADGVHARADGITSIAVVAGALGVAAGWPAADSIVGLVISIFILKMLWGAAPDIVGRLLDRVEPELVRKVETVLSSVEGVDAVGPIRLRWVGHCLQAEATIMSRPDLSLVESHEIANRAHHTLLHEVPRFTYAIIHSEPFSDDSDSLHVPTQLHFRQR
jgi:cation diffusion facilitator family transporter